MKRFEQLVGTVMASILLLIIVFAISSSLFRLLFREGRGMWLYGGRGEFYMSE